MDQEMDDFVAKVIDLKAKGFFIEDMCNVWGPQFDGMYRWMNSKTFEFQQSDPYFSEVEAWKVCILQNS